MLSKALGELSPEETPAAVERTGAIIKGPVPTAGGKVRSFR